MALYKGYSSHEYHNNKTFKITDQALVNLDLLNHIYTARGSRLMMPNFGTRIPMMAFEPLDGITVSIVENDLRAVVDFDPRVSLQSIQLVPSPDTNALTAQLVLYYIELNMTGNLNLNIIFEDNP